MLVKFNDYSNVINNKIEKKEKWQQRYIVLMVITGRRRERGPDSPNSPWEKFPYVTRTNQRGTGSLQECPAGG